jgi:putative ABC transport system permease protein
MRILWQDIRYAFRMLARRPGFAAVVVVILAIGIGANTAVFSVVNAVLLRPLPYRDPDRLVALFQQRRGGTETNIGRATFAYWREHNEVFEQIAARYGRRVYLAGLDRPPQMDVEAVSPCLFSLLGVKPVLGRTFLSHEEQLGDHRVVVLSHAFWQDQWGGDPNVIGEIMMLDGEPYSIVGVMGPGFRQPLTNPAPFWLPLVLEKSYAVLSIARLKEGVTIEQARVHMDLLARQYEQIDPEHSAGYTVAVHRYLDDLFGEDRRILLLLLGSAAFVLLIACSNVANLLLARVALRRQEIGVRLALGASRGRIVRQTLTESVMLGAMGGLLGLLGAWWAVRILVGLCPVHIPRIGETRVDWVVLAFTLGLSMLTSLLFGLTPAWRTADPCAGQVLREGLTRSQTGGGRQRLRDGLVVAQIAIALTLLMGAALLIQSLMALQKVDLGFQAKDALVMNVELPQVKYPRSEQHKAFFDQLMENVRAVPDVRSAALVSVRLDLAQGGGTSLISIGSRPANPEELLEVSERHVGRDFFETMGMRVLRGRTFTEQDVQAELTTPPQNLIIDETLARKHFAGTDPIGQRIYYDDQLSGTVVGVVSSIKDFEELAPDSGVFYKLLSQRYFYRMQIVVRTDGEPLRLADALEAQVRALDKDRTCELQTLESMLAEMLGPRRFSMSLLGVYAATALVIACIGLYGLLQFTVVHRTQEIGIRMALGATRARIVGTVLRQAGLLIAAGCGLGLVGGYGMSRVVASLLYETKPTDPAVLAIVLATLLGTAFAACYVPARRAAGVNPMVALRYE